jgi:hypothetical protein
MALDMAGGTAGDHLIAMGEPKQLRKLEQLLMGVA